MVHAVHVARLADAEYVPDGHAWHWRSANGPHGNAGLGCVPAGHDARHAVHCRFDVAVASWVWYSWLATQTRVTAHTVSALGVQALTWYEPAPQTVQTKHDEFGAR